MATKRKYTIQEKRYRTVVKANELIQKSRFNLSIQQQKVLLYLISQIQPNDEDFREYEFSIQDFCKVSGIDANNGKNYQDLKKAIKEIADKSLWVMIDEDTETLLRWIEKPYIDHKSGLVRIRLDKDMKPFLLQLKENFTQYELLYTLGFKSKYSIRLYELIKSIHYHELETYERTYTLEELKMLLDAETYKTYKDFKVKVLNKAIEEINNISDKVISYEPIKGKGKSIAQIKLILGTKKFSERLKIADKVERQLGIDPNQLTLWDEIMKNGR